jgi:hypothetical protein
MPNLLESLITGGPDPRLSHAQNELLRQQSLQQAGFAGLISAGEGQSLLSTLGTIGQTGHEVRQGRGDELLEQQAEAEERELARQQLSTQVVTKPNGDMVLVNKQTGEDIALIGKGEVKKDLGQPMAVKLPSGDEVFAFPDRARGIFVDATGQPMVGAKPIPRRKVQIDVEPIGGLPAKQWADPVTGERFGKPWVAGFAPKSVTGDSDKLEDNEKIGMTLLTEVQRMVDILEPRGFIPFNAIETAIQSESAEGLESLALNIGRTAHSLIAENRAADIQVLNDAGGAVVTAVVRMREGGRPSDKDREFFKAFVVPRPGDTAPAVEAKLARVMEIAQLTMQGKGGEAFDMIWQRIPHEMKVKAGVSILPPSGEGSLSDHPLFEEIP